MKLNYTVYQRPHFNRHHVHRKSVQSVHGTHFNNNAKAADYFSSQCLQDQVQISGAITPLLNRRGN